MPRCNISRVHDKNLVIRPTQSQEIPPLLPELRPLAKILELRRQHRLNILLINRKEDSLTNNNRLDGIRILRVTSLTEDLPPELVIPKVREVVQRFEKKVNVEGTPCSHVSGSLAEPVECAFFFHGGEDALHNVVNCCEDDDAVYEE